MPRSLIVVLFSLVLTSSILIPSVMGLMDNEQAIVMNEFNENENKDNQDNELEDLGNEEEKIFVTSFDFANHTFNCNDQVTSSFHLLGTSIHSVDIKLPPPEHTL